MPNSISCTNLKKKTCTKTAEIHFKPDKTIIELYLVIKRLKKKKKYIKRKSHLDGNASNLSHSLRSKVELIWILWSKVNVSMNLCSSHSCDPDIFWRCWISPRCSTNISSAIHMLMMTKFHTNCQWHGMSVLLGQTCQKYCVSEFKDYLQQYPYLKHCGSA